MEYHPKKLLTLALIVFSSFSFVALFQGSVAQEVEHKFSKEHVAFQSGNQNREVQTDFGWEFCGQLEAAEYPYHFSQQEEGLIALNEADDQISVSLVEECGCCEQSCRRVKLMPYALYSWGQSVGICDSYATFGAMGLTSTCFPCVNAVADIGFHVTDKGKFGASTGVGFRCGDECCYDGYYLYYDYLEGRLGKYHQLGFSYEKIEDYYEFRLNTYLPVDIKGKKELKDVRKDFNNTGVSTPYVAKAFCIERPVTGFDVEAGSHCRTECFDAYAGFGFYYFGRDCCKDLLGMKGVLRFFCGQFFEAQGQLTWDRCNRVLLRGQIAVKLPFDLICDPCGFKSCWICPPNRIYRDGPIHLDRCCEFKTNF